MRNRCLTACFSLLCVAILASSTFAASDDAAAKFAQGNALLAKGDFDGAQKAYVAAAKAAPDNEEYVQRATLIRRVIEVRQKLDKLTGDEWVSTAAALHAFYDENQIYTEALPLARKVHEKLRTADSAVALARTQLAMKQNADAAELLRGLSKEQTTLETQSLLSLALARQGDIAAAKTAAAGLAPPPDTAGQVWFDLASVYALTGDADKALAALTHGFETTPPSQLEATRERVKQSADYASVKTRPDFAKVCATESKVAESKCSSGASCAKCPSRTKCAKDQPDPAKKDQEPCKDHPQGDKPTK
jgi:tetratricopeptide (TPR) repeat protein